MLNTPSAGSERAVSNALMVLYYGVYAPAPSEPVVSPNGDGVAEAEQVAYKVVRPSAVKARLLGPDGKVVWKEQEQREPGTYPFQVAKDALTEGVWRWVVSAVDADGVESKIERTFRVNNTLGFLDLSAPTIKVKKKRGGSLGVTFKVTKRARVVVTVEDELGRFVADPALALADARRGRHHLGRPRRGRPGRAAGPLHDRGRGAQQARRGRAVRAGRRSAREVASLGSAVGWITETSPAGSATRACTRFSRSC